MFFEWIAEHWEFIAGVVAFIVVCILAVFYLRAQNKQTINATQTETIDAQKRLLETRTAERDARECERDEWKAKYSGECEAHEATDRELAALRSEFKIVGAIVLDELIAYWSRRTSILAENEMLKNDNAVLQLMIERRNTELAERKG